MQALWPIGAREHPATAGFGANDIEELWRDHDASGERMILRRRIRDAVHRQRAHLGALRGQVRRERDGPHTWLAIDALNQLIVELPLRLLSRVIVLEQADMGREHAVRLEPVIEVRHVQDRLDHESGRHQQAARDCDLRDDQALAHTSEPQARRSPRFVVEDLGHVRARGSEGRNRAGEDGREERQADHERDHARIEAGDQPERQLLAGESRVEEVDPDLGHDETRRRTHDREHESLRQQLRHGAPPARSQRRPNRHLFRSNEGPSQQQVGDIRTSNEQHAKHGTQHRVQHGDAFVADEQVDLAHGLDPHAFIRLRILRGEPPGDRRHLGLRLLERDAIFEPRQ